jgi:hypothetical protein
MLNFFSYIYAKKKTKKGEKINKMTYLKTA